MGVGRTHQDKVLVLEITEDVGVVLDGVRVERLDLAIIG
jgi:hypothetical protein